MHNKQLKTLLVLLKWKKTHQTRFYAGNSDNKRQRAPSAGSSRTHELRASWSCQFVGCLKKRYKNCTYWCLHLLRQDRAVRKAMLSLYSPVPFKGFRQGHAGWGEVASLSRSTHCELNLLGRVCAQKDSTRFLKAHGMGANLCESHTQARPGCYTAPLDPKFLVCRTTACHRGQQSSSPAL